MNNRKSPWLHILIGICLFLAGNYMVNFGKDMSLDSRDVRVLFMMAGAFLVLSSVSMTLMLLFDIIITWESVYYYFFVSHRASGSNNRNFVEYDNDSTNDP